MKEVNHSSFSQQNWNQFYSQTLSLLDRLFHDCHLVHGDLSEYNLLLHSPSLTVYVIDFGQSVDISHPHHLDFLQRDIRTINQFYQRKGVTILSEEIVTHMILSGDRSLTRSSSRTSLTGEEETRG
jgi:serine/threonine-protein kinase RIO1